MKVADLPVKEVDSLCGFSTRQKLADHVVKHVFENREERWHRLLDAEEIGQARHDFRTGRYTPAFWRVAGAYCEVIANAILTVCQSGQQHSHNALVDPLMSFTNATGEVIYAWPLEERLFICAGSFVRNEALTPYAIWTGYRAWPTGSRNRFLASAREKAREMDRLKYPPIAVHDSEGSGDE